MTNITTKTIKIAIAAALLLSQTACMNTQTAPSMVDYSYVPPSSVMSVQPTAGIQDY